MNYKTQAPIVVLNSPPSFLEVIEGIETHFNNVDIPQNEFSIAFATKQSEVDMYAQLLNEKLLGDGLLWFAYPKGTSKKFKCEFNRDNGWALLGKLGYEPVRMVAIDEDWSALRFRRVQYIKTLTRGFAMSDEGIKKVEESNKNK